MRPALGAWRQAEQIARAALAGYVETRSAKQPTIMPIMSRRAGRRCSSKVAQIGQHIFYRWPGAWGQPAAFTGRYIGEPRDPLSMRPPPPIIASLACGRSRRSPQAAGPPVPRADNDVGGLLDTSKGWTLSIPGPDDSDSAAARLVASQERKPRRGRKVAAADAPAVIASR